MCKITENETRLLRQSMKTYITKKLPYYKIINQHFRYCQKKKKTAKGYGVNYAL